MSKKGDTFKPVKGLYAFWRYEGFPHVLGGAITAMDAHGRVRLADYGGGVVRPIKLVQATAGAAMLKKLETLRAEYRLAQKAFDAAWRLNIVQLIGPEASADAATRDASRARDERHYCQVCDIDCVGPCPIVGHRSEHLQPDTGGRWTSRKPMVLVQAMDDGTFKQVLPEKG